MGIGRRTSTATSAEISWPVLKLIGLQVFAFHAVDDDFGEELFLNCPTPAKAVFLMLADPHLEPFGKLEVKSVGFWLVEELTGLLLSRRRYAPFRLISLACSPEPDSQF
jgi:hypothetical protein